MKKLKFLALGLVAAFGFASCGDEEEVAFTSKEAKTTNTQIVMGGSKSTTLGSSYTFDKGVQTLGELGDNATNVVFCLQTIDENDKEKTLETFRFVSGTRTNNKIINGTQDPNKGASETVFAMIGDATIAKAAGLNESDFTATTMDISRKLENGKKAVAFWNKTLNVKGFFEITNFVEANEEMSLNMFIIQE